MVVLQYLDGVYCFMYFRFFLGALVAQYIVSARAFHLRYRGVQIQLGTTYESHVKGLSQRSAESRGFFPGTSVSSQREY